MTTGSFPLDELDKIVSSPIIEWRKFRGKCFLVTGASGYIGSSIVYSLVYANEVYGLGMRVVALVRDVGKAKSVLGAVLDDSSVKLVVGDVTEPIRVDVSIDYIFHAASITASKTMVDHPYETILTTIKGTENVLALAIKQKVDGMVYLSTMEVYGTPAADDYEMFEDKFGYVNPLLPRSSYPESKRMAEGMCAAVAHEHGIRVVIARLAQTFGVGVGRSDNRIFAQFARAVVTGQNIVLKTDGTSERCYCSTRDAVTGLLALQTKGENGEAYNLSNEDTFCSIRDMAERLIAAHPESGTKLLFEIADDVGSYGYLPPFRMKIMNSKMRALGWNPQVGLDEMFDQVLKAYTFDAFSKELS